MKASFYKGERTIAIEEVEPRRPGPGEVRLEVAYCGICGTDVHIFHGAMDGRVAMPQTIGHEASGVVAEVGPDVTGWAPGDWVVVRPLDNREETPADRGFGHVCAKLKFIGIDSPGALQASWVVPAFTLHRAPAGLDLRTAALTEPLAVACHDVRLGGVQPDELAVVIGGGPIGVLVAWVAQATGARVLLSEIDPYRLRFARELGLDAVDPRETDLSALCRERSGGSGADIVFEVSGAKAAALAMTDLLAIRGRVVMVAIHPKPTEINLFHVFWKELKMIGARVYEPEDFEKALELMASRAFPVERIITADYPLDRVAEAFAALDRGGEGMKTLVECRPGEGLGARGW
jgi:(R,R)-butanediol dehydrogenase / meso-butanediol dehydrogenase / diacetyl reductase